MESLVTASGGVQPFMYRRNIYFEELLIIKIEKIG